MNPVLIVLICALAAHRVARAIALDGITDPARDWIYQRAFTTPVRDPFPAGTFDEDDARREGWLPPPPAARRSRPWAWLYGLVSCPHCVGFWLSLGAWWWWEHRVGSHPWIAAVAVAGAQSIFAAKGVE